MRGACTRVYQVQMSSLTATTGRVTHGPVVCAPTSGFCLSQAGTTLTDSAQQQLPLCHKGLQLNKKSCLSVAHMTELQLSYKYSLQLG
jgi:hypothetical protein